MAEKRRVLDLLIVETNTLYREVPFAVVTDWIQEGRLLPEDKVRVSGTEKWRELVKVSAFQPYFPRPEPQRVEDAAEAHEQVSGELDYKAHHDEEDDDPDMIPLIDISLVLLIFFLMTAAVSSGVLSPIQVPPAKYQLAAINEEMYWVGIDVKDHKGKAEKDEQGQPRPWYSFGKTDKAFDISNGDKQYSTVQLSEVTRALYEKIKDDTGEVRVRIRADQTLPIEIIRETTVELQKLEMRLNGGQKGPQRKVTVSISGEVSEPQ